MRKVFSKFTFAMIAGAMFVATCSVAQADIVWGTSTQIVDGGGFIDTTGTLVAAINADDNGDNAVIGGVTFAGNDLAAWNGGIAGVGGVTISSNATNGNFGTTFTQGSTAPNITDTDITNLIGSGIWNPQTVTLSGLAGGETYTIQLLVNDSRNGRSTNNVAVLGDGTGTLAQDIEDGTAGFNIHSFTPPTGANPRVSGGAIIGTFVAAANGIQTFDVGGSTNAGESTNSDGRAQINGLQLRLQPAAVPEPSSLAVLALGSLVFARRRRR